MTWVADLGKPGVKRGLQQGSWIAGPQFEPCPELGLLAVRCIVSEFDAEMTAAGKAHNEHRLGDARPLDCPHRATQERLKALSQFFAPVRAREDMRVAAESDHDPTGPSRRFLGPAGAHPLTRRILPQRRDGSGWTP